MYPSFAMFIWRHARLPESITVNVIISLCTYLPKVHVSDLTNVGDLSLLYLGTILTSEIHEDYTLKQNIQINLINHPI